MVRDVRGLPKKPVSMAVLITALMSMLVSCVPTSVSLRESSATAEDPSDQAGRVAPRSIYLPLEDGTWRPSVTHASDTPEGWGQISIQGTGAFPFEAGEVRTLRPDIYQPGHFSLFDILAHLNTRGEIALDYYYDQQMQTHVIDAINGVPHWWYGAYYLGGWPEASVVRMDHYPYKDGTNVWLEQESPERLERIYETFRQEVYRLEAIGGRAIVPEVRIESPRGEWIFENVPVTAHGVRADMLQPTVITALDILLSLGESGQLSHLRLTWYERLGTAEIVGSYWIEAINDIEAYRTCGFVYETGPREFSGFRGSHIHIPSDVRVIVSPEYALWFWICL